MGRPRKLILRCRLSPGDIVMLTAAVRDLHRCYPGQFLTDVRTSASSLWDHNPYITPLHESDPDCTLLDCEYPLIHVCHREPVHCLHGFIDYLNRQLGLAIRPTEFKGDIHLSFHERKWISQVDEITGEDTPFWILAGGGKFDVTIKWWSHERYQEVVDAFRDRILFVQVGQQGHWHPKLQHTLDLRGMTSIRQLVRLSYHAQGILCGVTFLMHLAAAVPVRPGRPSKRPCVVVAGGREPAHWEAYPAHQFIHTVGTLPCCDKTGCWKTRTVPLYDGDPRDAEEKRCQRVVGGLPQCMDMISSDTVKQRIDWYLQGGAAKVLSPAQIPAARKGVEISLKNRFDQGLVHESSVRLSIQRTLNQLSIPPIPSSGRGVLCCAGNAYYFQNALISLSKLRATGCSLRIELWVGPDVSVTESHRREFEVLHIDLRKVESGQSPSDDWRFKAYALYHSPLRHAVLLDADCELLVDPDGLLDLETYQKDGLITWKDAVRIGAGEPVWNWFDLNPNTTPMLDTGVVILDRERHGRLVAFYQWLAQQGPFFDPRIGGNGCLSFAISRTVSSFEPFAEGAKDGDGNLTYSLPDGQPVFLHCSSVRRFYQIPSFIQNFANVPDDAEFPAGLVFHHGFPNQNPMDDDTRRRNRLAESTWEDLSQFSPWNVCSVGYDILPRLFRDGGRRLFFVKDLIAVLMSVARERDVIVVTNADACLSKSTPKRILEALEKNDACYSARRDFSRLKRPLEDHEISQGRPYSGVDLIAFRADWWRQEQEEFPDLLLGAEAWDWCFRVLIQSTTKGAGRAFDDLVYHEQHTSFWCRNGNRSLLPSQQWNRSLAKPFLEKMGRWPVGGAGWEGTHSDGEP